MTESLDPQNATAYRRRARPIVMFGIAAAFIGIAGLVNKSLLSTSSAADRLTEPVDTLWLLSYGVGGLLVVAGIVWLRPAVEVVGDWLLLAALTINALAILLNRGPVGGGLSAFPVLLAVWVVHGRITDLHAAALAERRILPEDFPGPERRH